MPDPAPSRDEIMDALNRILGWTEIMRSPQLARFLGHIVERTLDGADDAIKAYSIAVDVFGRPPDFDPQSDPIVRVQARRLRGLLDDYYRTTGKRDPIRISLPTGRYVPEFNRAAVVDNIDQTASPPEAPPLPVRLSQRWKGEITLPWFTLLVMGTGIAALAYSVSTWEPRQGAGGAVAAAVSRPMIVIAEFQNLTGDENRLPMAAGLAIELVTDLAQFEDIGVRYEGGNEAPEPTDSLVPAEFVLNGIVRNGDGVVQYSAILTESATGNVVWNHTISLDAAKASDPATLDGVSRALSLILGSPRGPLHAPARLWLAAKGAAAGQESLYACLVLFHAYRDSGLSSDGKRADACFAGLPETKRQSPVALAAIASLMAEYLSPDETTVLSPADRYGAAEANLARAMALAPVSGFVWEQQARLFEAEGRMEEARAAYGSAIQLNPANADVLAGFARFLAFRGNLEAALPMAILALDVPDPPAWFYGVPALAALHSEDFNMAIGDAGRYALADRELGPIIAVMASLRLGDSSVVNRYLPQILDMPSFRAMGILPQLRKRLGDEALLEQVRSGLTEAGVPPEALMRPF